MFHYLIVVLCRGYRACVNHPKKYWEMYVSDAPINGLRLQQQFQCLLPSGLELAESNCMTRLAFEFLQAKCVIRLV
jgi:hypothetical protein